MSTTLSRMVGQSAAMQALAALILKVAPHDCTVLIHGESGTGKELVARSIQENSKRSTGPFLTVNCGAMPDTLAEALLFGHEKGSFTGASADKRGLLEATHGGTIFLDEIGEMPLSTQVKLLRALQEKEVIRVGSTRPIKVDVRVIAATNRDLKKMVSDREFRRDLYYRIATFEIDLPPLRERREDIPALARHFLDKLRADGRIHRPITIDDGALDLLASYDWPGNVRELENAVSRLTVIADGEYVTTADVESVLPLSPGAVTVNQEPNQNECAQAKLMLPPSASEVCDNETVKTYMRRVKLQVLTAAVAQYPNRAAAAARLGLTKGALKNQLHYLRQAEARSKKSQSTDRSNYE